MVPWWGRFSVVVLALAVNTPCAGKRNALWTTSKATEGIPALFSVTFEIEHLNDNNWEELQSVPKCIPYFRPVPAMMWRFFFLIFGRFAPDVFPFALLCDVHGDTLPLKSYLRTRQTEYIPYFRPKRQTRNAWKWYPLPCYVMLCYVMLCYVMLCYVMLCIPFTLLWPRLSPDSCKKSGLITSAMKAMISFILEMVMKDFGEIHLRRSADCRPILCQSTVDR